MAVKFLNTGNFPDNVKLTFGNDPDQGDIQIYSDNTTAYIEMPHLDNFVIGDSTEFASGNISLVREAHIKCTKSIEEDYFCIYTNANTCLSYMTSSGTTRFNTTNSGVAVTGNVTATGDVQDRDIPCLFNSNFFDGTSSSIQVVPFNSLSETTISSRTYYHNLTMPYAGKLVKVVMKNVSGSLSSSFTTQLFLYVNGSQQTSSAELSLSNSAVTWTPTTSNTFSAGDELSFAYQKSASGKTFAGVSFGVAIELTDYDI